MRFEWKRLCALALTIALILTLLPGGFVSAEAATATLTEADYAKADAVFAKIEAMEKAPAKKNAAQTQKTNAAIKIVEASDSYAEGSLERNGNMFTWWTEDGIRCAYNPRMQKIRENMEPENLSSRIVNEPVATRGGMPSGNQVYLIAPYYGADESFGAQYRIEAREVAQAIGDSDGYTLYSGKAATIDKVAEAVSNGAVVFFDSHGITDYQNETDDEDYITEATTSYMCLSTQEGLTSADYGLGALYSYTGDVLVNGKVIANHMQKNSPNGIVWMALCLGMATDGMYKPLRDKGVEVVYGYSQSVSFDGDYLYEETFWDEMKSGKTVAQAAATMKETWGEWDWSDKMVGYEGCASLAKARQDYVAFPVVVSDEDPHPGKRTASRYSTAGNFGADSLQTVQSTYTLGQVYPVTDPTNPKVILEEAYALRPREVLPYDATLTGKVTKVASAYSAQYGNVTVIMEVPGYESMPIKCYRLAGSGVDRIGVGDTITVKGTVVNYEHSSGNTEVEFMQSCELLSWEDGDIEIDIPLNPDTPVGDASTLYFNTLANRVSFSATKQVWQQNGVTAINEKTANSDNIVSNYDPVRFYAFSKLTIQSKDMVKLVIKCASEKYAKNLYDSISISGAEVTLSGSEVTIELAESADSIVIDSLEAQVRVDSIGVYAAEPEPTAPIDLKGVNVDFASSLTLNFNNTEEVLGQYEDLYVIFEVEGEDPVKVTDYTLSVDSSGKTRYNFGYEGLTVMDLNVTVYATVHGTFNGQPYQSETKSYSLLRYVTKAITDSTSDAVPCANLLKYAIAAEAYKQIPAEERLENILTVEEEAAMEQYAYADSCVNVQKTSAYLNGSRIKFSGQSVLMDSRITLIYKMEVSDTTLDPNKLSFKVTYTDSYGNPAEKIYGIDDMTMTSAGNYELYFAEFHATQLRAKAKCTIYIDGAEESYYENSVENYCYVVEKGNNTVEMKYLAKRISLYGDACAATYGN